MKIIHIFNVEKGTFFIKCFVNALLDENNGFNKDIHDVCIRNEELAKQINSPKVFYDGDKGSLIEKYVKLYDVVFLHGLASPDELLDVPPKYLSRIVWRTWGGRSGLSITKRKNVFAFVKKALRTLKLKRQIKHLLMVCGANYIDRYDTLQKKSHFMVFPYYSDIQNNKITLKDYVDETKVNIIVGHSAYHTDKHDNALAHIQKWVKLNPNIHIYVPVTYGVDKYRDGLIARWKPIYQDRITFVNQPMPLADYNYFLSQMDFAFLLGDRSYALGNIQILLNSDVLLVLSKKGVIHKALKKLKIKHFVLTKKFFKSIPNPISNNNLSQTDLKIFNKSECINQMKDVFNFIERGNYEN